MSVTAAEKYTVSPEIVGKSGTCGNCHGRFQAAVAVYEESPARPPERTDGGVTETAMCARHPTVRAAYACALCQAPLCKTCEFPQSDGTHRCPDCATKPSPSGTVAVTEVGGPSPAAAGQMCRWHPNVSAVQVCTVCTAPVCRTCDFAFPGDVHLCPRCATTPQQGVTGKRRTYLIWSYVLAVLATFTLAVILSGALASVVETEEGVQVVGLMMMVFILVPAIVGTALGGAAMRRHSSPVSTWVALIWNILIIAAFLLLTLIGSLRG